MNRRHTLAAAPKLGLSLAPALRASGFAPGD